MATPGYSGKPLYQKLGIKPGFSVLAINAPADYLDLIAGHEGHLCTEGLADIVHLFCPDRATLEREITPALAKVAPAPGMLWLSWPKKSSKQFVDLTEDMLREVILPTGWVDVKVCAVSDIWSGLKFTRRRS